MSRYKRRRGHPRYPNVRCGNGHPDEPGYVVCGHVRMGKPVHRVILAKHDELGQILCKDGRHDETDKQASLICAHCARAKGWLTCTCDPF